MLHSRRSSPTRPVVSATAYARLLRDPVLGRRLLPGGLSPTPYEVLDYAAVLTLHDPEGVHATFRRLQRVRFLQDGVSALLDHAWGDGVLLTDYHTDAGELLDGFPDGNRRQLVIGLARRMRVGEELTFNVERQVLAGFTQPEEWIETTIDHPVGHLTRGILFPRERPCHRAVLHTETRRVPLPVRRLASGRTLVQVRIPRPLADVSYTVRWAW